MERYTFLFDLVIQTVKMIQKAVYRFKAISLTLPMSFFTELDFFSFLFFFLNNLFGNVKDLEKPCYYEKNKQAWRNQVS